MSTKPLAALPPLTTANLPREILTALVLSLSTEFIAIAPNTAVSLITCDSIVELPPGYTVTIVFNQVDPVALPREHRDGEVYRLA